MTGALISYSAKCAEESLRAMATAMEDTEMLARISAGDLVAIDAKYYFSCLTKYRNTYRSFCRQKNPENNHDAIARTQAFVEIVTKIEHDIEDGTNIFHLNELHTAYTNRCQQFGITSMVSKTAPKNKLLLHFQDFGLKDVFNKGRPSVFIFLDGIKYLLEDSKLLRNYENEAFIFARVAFHRWMLAGS